MDVGKKYLVFRDGHSFVDDRGNLVSFDPECKRLLILPKPATVIMDDGETESLEPIPLHLQSADWFAVKNLDSDNSHFFNITGWHAVEISGS